MILFRLFAFAGAAVAISACSNAVATPDKIELACPAVLLAGLTPAAATLTVGDTLRVVFAYARGCNDSIDHRATFSVSNSGLATVDSAGLITAKSAGVVTVTGTSIEDADVKGSALITIH
jgi:protein involved in polysaccharide export with SLBB domain